MADLIRKPGVEITQVISATPTTQVTPTLAPCVVGPAFEVVETTVDGAANNASVVSGASYLQQGLSISPSSFPTNHADISEVSVSGLTDEISAALFRPQGTVVTLDPDAQSAFLDTLPVAHKPALFVSDALFQANLAVDATLRLTGTGITQAQIVQLAIGDSVADVVTKIKSVGFVAEALPATSDYALYITLPSVSASYGPNAYINIKEETATSLFTHHALDIQVNGAGLQAVPANGSTTTSIISKSTGKFYLADLAGGLPAETSLDVYGGARSGDNSRVAWLPLAWDGLETSALIATKTSFPDFNALNLQSALPTRNGDNIVADGVNLGQVLSILPSSIEVGTVNTDNSQYNADGSILNQVYTRSAFTKDFSPKRVYFIANALSAKELDGTVNARLDTNISANVTQASSGSLDLTLAGGADLAGLALIVKAYESGAEVDSFTFVFPSPQASSAVAVFSTMQDQIAAANEARLFTVSESGGTITLATSRSGSQHSIKILSVADGSTAIGAALLVTGSGAAEVSDFGSDLVATNNDLNEGDASFALKLDDNPHTYTVSVGGRLVEDLVDSINSTVGYPVASIVTAGLTTTLRVQSSQVGRASYVDIAAFAPLGIGDSTASGSGRPNPDISVNSAGVISLGANIIRNARTGTPLTPVEIGNVSIGVAYRGLRLDLSTAANAPGLLQIHDISDLTTQLSPVDTRNPLALGIYYAMLNAGDGVTVSAIGVDDVSSSEPEGTLLAYGRAAEFIEAHEVYAVAPLTHSEEVIAVFNQHVTDMSAAEGKKERVLISSPTVPTRHNSVVLSSGENAEYANTTNLVNLHDGSLEDSAFSNGVDPSLPVPAVLADGTEVVLTVDINGETRNYSVSAISGSNVSVRVSGMSNADGFYSPVPINGAFNDATFSLFVRGAKLLVPGTNILNRQALATTVRDRAKQYNNRRQLRLFPDTVQSVIGGVEQSIPMYYFACAIAGETADLNPETPFSRRSMDGFTFVNTFNLTSNQLDIVSAGNCAIEVESEGMAPSIRIQCTTAPDTIETREYSIIKAVDSFAKQLRSALKGRVGLFNITQTYVDDTSTIVDVICQSAVDKGLLASAIIERAEQDTASPDTLRVDVNVGVLYPANYIKLTIFV